MNNELPQNEEKLLNFVLSNLFFYRAKSVTLDVKSHDFCEAYLIGCCPEEFPQYKGKIVRIASGSIKPNTVHDLSKHLVEQHTIAARSDINVRLPYLYTHNYIGLLYQTETNYPCPIMISSIYKLGSSFYLQFTAQNLEKKLSVLRKELDEWNVKNKDFIQKHGILKGIEI